jgi:hypothetical protein
MQQLLKLKRIVLETNRFASKNQVFLANLLEYITSFMSHQCKKVNGGFAGTRELRGISVKSSRFLEVTEKVLKPIC